jgi:hypothetical protein
MDNVGFSFENCINAQKEASENCSVHFIQSEPMLFTAFSITISVIHDAMQRNLWVSGRSDAEEKDRLILGGTFYQGIFVAERLSRESYFSQAAAVVRQQLECLAAIVESRLGKRISGKTPNISVLNNAFGKDYGNLSQIAHVSVPKKLEVVYAILSQDYNKPAVSILPAFNIKIIKSLYSLNILLTLLFAFELNDLFHHLYEIGLNEKELTTLGNVLALLEDIGAIEDAHLNEANKSFQRTLYSATE